MFKLGIEETETRMNPIASKRLIAFVLLYLAASLVHFIHNAEFLVDYPVRRFDA